MPDIHFECPKCKQPIDAPEEIAAQLVNCPTCNEVIEVPVRSRQVEPVKPPELPPIIQKESKDPIIVRIYRGSQEAATVAFQADAAKMAKQGYFPISQTWAPGAYGCGSFLLALLLCIVLIGIIVFIYMIIVKPPGALSVTYELR
ncbi:MAG: hypothetical protein ABSG87_05935 [Verrucomicrobiota bacterium]